MNGSEHYREAERLIGPDSIPLNAYGDEYDRRRADNLAEAQVHATLAQAAAVIELRSAYDATQGGITTAVTLEWESAVGERPAVAS